MKSKRIKGKAGGDAPEYRPPKIAKDNLIATSTAYLVEVISEGPIAGLVDGPRSIYFDQTPLSVLSSSGEQDQFEGVWYIERRGEPEQDYLTGFESIESEFVVNAEATNGYPVVRTINQDVDDIVVKVQIPQLQQVDPKTGDINKFKVQFAIEVAPSGSGNWTTVYDVTLKGKCSSPYQRAYRIENLHQWGPPPWDVRLRRISEDYSPPYKFGETWWASYTLCINEKISYADTAVIGFKIDASKFGSHVPERRYHVKGRIIKVPSNYNPDTREYSGEWDGTFKLAWTNNPAWILYDLLTHPRYGCGINPKFIDKWSLYQIGRYCDELVNSGILKDRIVANSQAQDAGSGKVKIRVENIDRFSVGEKIWIRGTANYNGLKIIDSILNPDSDGYDKIVFSSPYVEETFTNKAAVTYPEPRFTFNYTLQTREDAYKVIAQICSSFRGMAYWSSSAVLFRQDAPSDPIKIVTPANVIGGKFTYESSGTRAQHTVALVTWNDPKNMFKPTIEVVEDLAAIEKYGWNQIDIAAVGCTSRGQARRMGLWALYTERFESEVVTYSASWDHADVLPGDLVKLHDPTQKQAVDGGRIVSCTSTSAILDREPPLESGKTYLVTLVKPDGQLVERTISSWSSNTIYWSQAIQGDLPISGSLWLIAESQYDNATVYRIISVQETEPGIFRISAVRNNPIKYDLIEDFLFDEGMEGVYSRLPAFFPQVKTPPSSLEVSTSWTTVGDSVAPKASVTWVHPEAQFVDKYEVQYSSDTHDWITAGETQENSLDVILDQPGTYRFRVRAVDATPGPWVESSEVQIEYPDPPPQVSNVRVKGGGTSFSEDDCSIEWDSVESDTYGFLYQYVVKVYSTSDVLKRSEVVQGGQTSWVYTRGANEADFGVPTPSFKIGVAAVDVFGQVGPEVKITVSRVQIQPPSNLQTSSDILAVNLSWQAPSFPPAVSHYLIYRHTSNNRSQASLILKVPAPLLRAMDTTATPDLQYYYWIKAVDSWGVESDWNATSGVQGSARRVATADIMDNAVESAKIAAGAVSLTKFASSLRPIQVVSSLPSLPHSDFPQGAVVFLTTENKLYRSTGTTWVASVPTTDLSGQITETQIANDSISTPKIKTNAIEGYHIKSNSISSAHIQSDAIEAGHIKAGAVGTDELAAEAVTAQKIKAGEVYASKLNVAQIFVEALTVSNNSPSSGYVSWTSHTIYYQGTGYSISSGNTNNKYIYWDVGNTTLTASNTKPSWSATRFMILINDKGLHRLAWNATLIHGGTIVSNSITADEIAANSITVSKLSPEARMVFADTFDGSFDWVNYSGGGEIEVVSSSDSITGGKILRVGNNSGDDQAWLIHKALIPYDPNCVYRTRCRIRRTAGSGTCFIGFAGVAADGVTFVNVNGENYIWHQHYHVAGGWSPLSTWTLREGYTSGVSDPGSALVGTLNQPRPMHVNTKYLRPLLFVNCYNVPGITEVDMFTVEIIPNQVSMWAHGSDVTKIDGGEIYTRSITASQIASGTITANEIAAGTITAANIQARSITGDRLVIGTITGNEISANTITGNHIQGGTITGTHIASNTITGNHIQGGTITGTHIAGQTIQTDHLYAKAITTEKINDGAVNTDQVANLAITRANFFDVSDITNFSSTSETTIAQPNVYCKTTNDEVSVFFKCHVRMALQADGKGSYYSVPINFRVKHGSTILDRTSIDTGTLRNTTYIESAYCGLIGIRQPNTVGTVTFTVTAWLNDPPLTGAAAQIKNIKIWVLSKSK
ncbi:MAG: phage tail protein [Candidatus Methanomethylicaceae archaeon]